MEKVQNKVGRPQKSPSEGARNKWINIRVTESQRNQLKAIAEEKGLTVAELIFKTFNLK